MQVFHNIQEASRSGRPRAVAIGIFDGVHAGHRTLLRRAMELAEQDDLDSCALTFDPHPAQVLAAGLAPPMIESLSMRLERFGEIGLAESIVQTFSTDFASRTAEEFIESSLVGALKARHVIIGHGFVFGAGQRGTVKLLEEVGQKLGFEVHAIDQVRSEGIVVSSTKIREFLQNGQLRGANLLLERPFRLRGVIETGDQRGRKIGFPTANLRSENSVIPRTGVYAAIAHGDMGSVPTVVNVGYNPTFTDDKNRLKVEAHLLKFDGGELYGTSMELDFIERLRSEKRFESVEALKEQITNDIDLARKILERASSKELLNSG